MKKLILIALICAGIFYFKFNGDKDLAVSTLTRELQSIDQQEVVNQFGEAATMLKQQADIALEGKEIHLNQLPNGDYILIYNNKGNIKYYVVTADQINDVKDKINTMKEKIQELQ